MNRWTCCPICGSNEIKFYRKIDDFEYYLCCICAHKFTIQIPDERLLSQFYNERFYDRYMGMGYDKAFSSDLKYDFARKIKIIKNLFRDTQAISVLEIGSGPGYFARMLKEKLEIKDIVCIETSESAIEKGRSIGVDIYNVDLSNADNLFRGRVFDLIISWATVEHIPNPAPFVAALKNYLKKMDLWSLIPVMEIISLLFWTSAIAIGLLRLSICIVFLPGVSRY